MKIQVTISGTPGCQWLPELIREASEPEIINKRYSAFFGTDLETRLVKLECGRLILRHVLGSTAQPT